MSYNSYNKKLFLNKVKTIIKYNNMRYDSYIRVRMSKNEKTALLSKAKSKGVSLSQMIRTADYDKKQ